ncbi:MAG: PAS domain S-box protein, partial [Proteobacteria bacterium]|nr:PAS domain S-box protein [Pseudomonadota bacterium]
EVRGVMKKLLVLNLEDNPNDSDLNKEMLEDGGIECEITRVETEGDFLAACDKGGFDIILADFNLPSYDGLSALVVARERCPELPFIFVSGKMGEEIAIESLKSGAVDYILKNNLRRLAPSVRRALKEAELITERRQREEALRESEEKFRDLVENINDILFLTDDKGTITYISPQVNFILGYTQSEVVGRPMHEFICPEDLPYIAEQFQKRLSGILEPSEYRLINKSGEKIWIRSSSRPMIRENKVIGLRGLFADISKRKEAEEQLKRNFERLQKSTRGIIQAMALTVETRDPYTSGHQIRVAKLAKMIAREMNLSQDQVEGVNMAAEIHDIGKISVPAEILSKPSKLTDIEFQLIKIHPEAGYNIVKDIDFPWPIATMIVQHHERTNGSGYPKGLKGEVILLETRILSVADVVEAISSHRPYRPAYGIDIAIDEISQKKGILYDPETVDACLRLINDKGFKLE